jgi:Cu(I)/Ag(I) efflux system membrane fusion protein
MSTPHEAGLVAGTTRARRAARCQAAVLLALMCLVPLLGLAACRGRAQAPAGSSTTASARYHCPMHPTVVSDHPGACPICSMQLVPMAERAPSAGAETTVAGRATLALDAQRRQLLGLRSEPVQAGRLQRVLRTVGRVAIDERRLHHVHTKYEAWVERLYVDFTGAFVREGQPLLALYSPELVASQQEYLLALRAQRQLAQSGIASVAQGGVELLEAARQRLLFWDIRPAALREIERTGTLMRGLDLHAELSGYVVQKNVFHGMRVTPADTLFDIADLSRVWVLADVYEHDLATLRLGLPAEVRLPYLPTRVWHGSVAWIAPTVEEQTRTIKLRIEVDNHDGALKPEMFADVFLDLALGAGLSVPESALVPTGEGELVFVDLANGQLEPRAVRVGQRLGERVQILSGLAEGERVVTSANFLLDSESNLRAAIEAMGSLAAPSGHVHGAPTGAGAPGLAPASPRAPRNSPAPSAGHAHH